MVKLLVLFVGLIIGFCGGVFVMCFAYLKLIEAYDHLFFRLHGWPTMPDLIERKNGNELVRYPAIKAKEKNKTT